jgi:hypothetical protein
MAEATRSGESRSGAYVTRTLRVTNTTSALDTPSIALTVRLICAAHAMQDMPSTGMVTVLSSAAPVDDARAKLSHDGDPDRKAAPTRAGRMRRAAFLHLFGRLRIFSAGVLSITIDSSSCLRQFIAGITGRSVVRSRGLMIFYND